MKYLDFCKNGRIITQERDSQSFSILDLQTKKS